MKAKTIFVFTHDSIGLGEDGPTHQSIEHAASLRLIPQLDVWRPCDTVESAVAWSLALAHRGPSALLFTRQNVAFVAREPSVRASIARGGYILADFGAHDLRIVAIATGSEVALALGARERLAAEGIGMRVVSMPCTEQFDRQDDAYRHHVLPTGAARLAIEAGATDGWRKYVGAIDDPHAAVIGIDRFGESAPASALFAFFGFTVDNVVDVSRRICGRPRAAS
jgi:transketolase